MRRVWLLSEAAADLAGVCSECAPTAAGRNADAPCRSDRGTCWSLRPTGATTRSVHPERAAAQARQAR